jgi:hypothetical protein
MQTITPIKPDIKTAEKLIYLGIPSRLACILSGILLVSAAIALTYWPAQRKSSEITHNSKDNSVLSKSTSNDTSSDTVSLCLLISGAILIVFGSNGIRIHKANAKSGDISGTDETRLAALLSGPSKGEESPPESNQALQKPAMSIFPPDNVIETFLQISSFNGLKILYACQLSQIHNRPFSLRAMCTPTQQMSFDYAFGFLIASISAQIVIGAADPTTGQVSPTRLAPHADKLLMKYIEGNYNVHPQIRTLKMDQVLEIKHFFDNILRLERLASEY